jgi:hypothetical protein
MLGHTASHDRTTVKSKVCEFHAFRLLKYDFSHALWVILFQMFSHSENKLKIYQFFYIRFTRSL